MARRLGYLLFGAAGFIVIVLASNIQPRLPAGWLETQGTIVGFQLRDTGDGTVRAAVVEYTVAGRPYRVAANSGWSYGLGDKLGDTITLGYDPRDPSRARLLSGSDVMGWWVAIAVGVLFFGFGAIALLRDLRARGQVEQKAGPFAPVSAPASPPAASGSLAAIEELGHLGGYGYRFARARVRIWLDILIAPAMALMFGFFAWLMFSSGGGMALVAFLPGGVALLLLGTSLYSVRRGLFAPAAEVGAAGIWLIGLGRFRWDELAEVRLESFAGPAGEEGLAMYDRLAVVPRDPERARAAGANGLGMHITNAYYQKVMPLAGRRPINMAPVGLMAYEVADFPGLLARVREFFPLTSVSDEPVTA